MLKICPKCHRAYNDKCSHCSRESEELQKVIEYPDWLDGSFEDLKLCTEGLTVCRNVISRIGGKHYEDSSRFSDWNSNQKMEYAFKLSLNSRQEPIIIIKQACHISNRIYRKPYVGVIFNDSCEEEFISLDSFRSESLLAYNSLLRVQKELMFTSFFASWCTYEHMYIVLKEQNYKSFRIIREERMIDGYKFPSYVYVSE